MNIKTNEQILNDYYNCIPREDLFVKILDSESQYWAVRRITNWKNQRNEALKKNTDLSGVFDWLKDLNNQLAKLINEILSELKMVFDWKQNKIPIHNGNLEIRLRERLQPLQELPYGIILNLDDDEVLAFKMQQYCTRAFDLMISFVKNTLLIDIKRLPSFYLIQEIITNIENSIDFEKIKFTTETRKVEHSEPQQTEPEPLDLSNSRAVEKIIYLNELGIIDFLRTKPEFTRNINLMASFLSAITGVKPTTLQPSLNKLIINDKDDKNHPYRTTKTVEKVRQTLIDKNIKPKASLD